MKTKVYEVIGRMSGNYSLEMKTKFVVSKSKNEAKKDSGFDFIKSIYLRNDIKPEEI